jgi:hypothetical protein
MLHRTCGGFVELANWNGTVVQRVSVSTALWGQSWG